MIALDTSPPQGAKIKVIGVGGGGGNAINNMIQRGLKGVDFIAANTDKQALDHNLAPVNIQLGAETTRGLGAGADPEIGKKSVEESTSQIRDALEGSDMVFVTSGMGGGTGTGGAPLIAKIGQDLGALVVAIVTRPFLWEGRKRGYVADLGIKELRQYVDALIVIPNQRLLDIIDRNTTFGDAFRKVDEVLYNATKGISDIISNHGVINVDFADVKTVMRGMGDALMGIGTASGEHRAVEATQNALNSPLLDGISISGALGVLVNISGGSDLTMHEVAEAVSIVEKAAGENANLIHGVVYHEEPTDEMMVTVVATGFRKQVQEVPQIEIIESKPLPVQQSITFGESGNGVKGVYQRTGMSLDNAVRLAMKKGPQPVGITESATAPKGVGQLKDYDKPAYERRGSMPEITAQPVSNGNGSGNGNGNGNGISHVSIQNELAIPAIEDIPARISSERPAFLRKIMD